MKRLALIALVAGCATQASDDYPVQPGGNTMPAPTVSNTGTISGRACVVSDPRNLTECATSGASGLTVTADGQSVTTDATGSFSLTPAADSGMPQAITITGADVVPTRLALTSASDALSIPVVRAELFAQMMAANGVTLASGSGSILGSVSRGGSPITGVTVTSTPTPAFGPLFDGTTPTSWTLNGTGARGVVWIPGVAAGPTNLTFRDLASSGETTVDGVQVINGGITIMDAILP